MRNIFTTTLIAGLSYIINITNVHSAANLNNVDTTMFESQRQRVNILLEERSKQFGDFDVSLHQKTGIFGLFKTNSDMQRSIDILKNIVINDNIIFLETRKLLDLKDSEREHFRQIAQEFDGQVTAYMKTISKLQEENEKLKTQITNLENEDHSNGLIAYIIGLLLLGALYIIYRLYKQLEYKKQVSKRMKADNNL